MKSYPKGALKLDDTHRRFFDTTLNADRMRQAQNYGLRMTTVLRIYQTGTEDSVVRYIPNGQPEECTHIRWRERLNATTANAAPLSGRDRSRRDDFVQLTVRIDKCRGHSLPECVVSWCRKDCLFGI